MDQSNDAVQVSFGDLNVGEMYDIKSAKHEVRIFDGKSVDSVKLDISKSSLLKRFTYVPSGILKYALSIIDDINKASDEKNYYKACFYGTIGNDKAKRFIGRIHKPDEGVLEELLKEVADTSKLLMKKRSASDLSEEASSSSPAKVPKMGSGSDLSEEPPKKGSATTLNEDESPTLGSPVNLKIE
ncbi:Retinoic acid-induced protein 1 [Frankliniella fusca]|uniref:Retinoic acid-induced protein 1 n=1 Tax=Frankliniella fusca TaxID=407009 RepID=A0AAE1HKI0_9NEOP|nr:Retinoic acid-induced protein 1 [Frankliniella fusca]